MSVLTCQWRITATVVIQSTRLITRALTAVVWYEGGARKTTVAISGGGARYMGGGLEWWMKGMEPGVQSMLFRHKDDDTYRRSV